MEWTTVVLPYIESNALKVALEDQCLRIITGRRDIQGSEVVSTLN